VSGGEKQGWHCSCIDAGPENSSADEPTAPGLKTGELIGRDFSGNAQEQRRTVVVVSHDERLRAFATPRCLFAGRQGESN